MPRISPGFIDPIDQELFHEIQIDSLNEILKSEVEKTENEIVFIQDSIAEHRRALIRLRNTRLHHEIFDKA